MNKQGFTLLELLVTVSIASITLMLALPSFNAQIRQAHTETVTLSLLDAIETSRSTAVFRNSRTVLLAKDKKWTEGWTLFIDADNDGVLDDKESILRKEEKLTGVIISAKAPLDSYLSFIGTGEGRKPGKANSGAFMAGKIKICPEQKGNGYALILARGGRTRVEKLTTAECEEIRK
jgi:type IV fimbrial biogenesis protein FimT